MGYEVETVLTIMDIVPDLISLRKMYDEPGRYYHNADHILVMIDELASIDQAMDLINYKEYTMLLQAIFRHDAKWGPVQGEVSWEELSAQYHLSIKPEETRIADAIRATEHHFDGTEYTDPVTNLLLDLDLMAFTFDYEDFKKANDDIDREYLEVWPAIDVDTKRLTFMKSIKDNKSLRFRIHPNSESMTKRAYENIDRWISDKLSPNPWLAEQNNRDPHAI